MIPDSSNAPADGDSLPSGAAIAPRATVMVVDDDLALQQAFRELISAPHLAVLQCFSAEEALERLRTAEPDLVIIDVRLPGMNGLEALGRIRESHPRVPIIVMTGEGTMETAIEATKRGAFDYQLKPFDPRQMLSTVERALEISRLSRREVAVGSEPAGPQNDAIIGRSPAMQQLFMSIGRVAGTDATVLVRGESGTGKELVARAIYQHSRRHDKPLVAVSCVAIPETLLESELFGYERGAFTGAAARRIGKFEQAHGGTIFLDEIGDVPIGVQAKILRVLQERQFERLGGNTTIDCDVRVIAATNRDLERAIAAGQFREDLYHRLNVVTLRLPPLRDRREDIPALVDYFRKRFARSLGIEPPPISGDAMERLERHNWPGNIRELEHCLQRALIFTRGHVIQRSDIETALSDAGPAPTLPDSASLDEQVFMLVARHLREQPGDGALERLVNHVERALIVEALRSCGGNQTQAARLLGLPRPTLHAKMQKHDIRLATDVRQP